MTTRTTTEMAKSNGKAPSLGGDVEAVLVTPALAAEWWAGKAPNRNYRKRVALRGIEDRPADRSR